MQSRFQDYMTVFRKIAAQFGSYLCFQEQKRIFCHQIERDQTGRACEMCGEKRNTWRVLVGQPEGKRPDGKSRRRWNNNIKIYHTGGWKCADWIDLAHDTGRLFSKRQRSFWFHRVREISWPAEKLSASQSLCSVKSVSQSEQVCLTSNMNDSPKDSASHPGRRKSSVIPLSLCRPPTPRYGSRCNACLVVRRCSVRDSTDTPVTMTGFVDFLYPSRQIPERWPQLDVDRQLARLFHQYLHIRWHVNPNNWRR